MYKYKYLFICVYIFFIIYIYICRVDIQTKSPMAPTFGSAMASSSSVTSRWPRRPPVCAARSKALEPTSAADLRAPGDGGFSPWKSWENHGKIMGKMGKPWENHGKIMGKSWENRKIICFWGFWRVCTMRNLGNVWVFVWPTKIGMSAMENTWLRNNTYGCRCNHKIQRRTWGWLSNRHGADQQMLGVWTHLDRKSYGMDCLKLLDDSHLNSNCVTATLGANTAHIKGVPCFIRVLFNMLFMSDSPNFLVHFWRTEAKQSAVVSDRKQSQSTTFPPFSATARKSAWESKVFTTWNCPRYAAWINRFDFPSVITSSSGRSWKPWVSRNSVNSCGEFSSRWCSDMGDL